MEELPKEVVKSRPKPKEEKVASIKKEVTIDNFTITPAPVRKAESEKKEANDGYKIQVGSFRTSEDADNNWVKIKSKHSDVFKGLQEYKERADLGDKGIFFRLQVGMFSSQSKARSVCQELIDKKQGCFVVRK